MTPEHALNARNCAAHRAHLAGAEWVICEKEIARLQKQAAAARALYFRELTTIDVLGGHIPSPFDPRA